MTSVVTDDELRAILTRFRRIAVVGLSDNPARPSYGVARYLIEQDYDVVGVNPNLAGQSVLGRPIYAALTDLPEPPEIVDVFRRSQFVARVVDDAIAAGARVVWTQLGVKDDTAAERGRAAGLRVVQNRCTAIEHERLLGGAPFL
ncbi:MAG: CoA-binding protein [Ktedonobacterales bacterium]